MSNLTYLTYLDLMLGSHQTNAKVNQFWSSPKPQSRRSVSAENLVITDVPETEKVYYIPLKDATKSSYLYSSDSDVMTRSDNGAKFDLENDFGAGGAAAHKRVSFDPVVKVVVFERVKPTLGEIRRKIDFSGYQKFNHDSKKNYLRFWNSH